MEKWGIISIGRADESDARVIRTMAPGNPVSLYSNLDAVVEGVKILDKCYPQSNHFPILFYKSATIKDVLQKLGMNNMMRPLFIYNGQEPKSTFTPFEENLDAMKGMD